MHTTGRRGGVGKGPGRALIEAGVACLVVAGCATDPPPALLMVVDAQALALQDSRLLPESTKVAIRSHVGRAQDRVWREHSDPDLEVVLDAARGTTALLDVDALPERGRTRRVMVDVPGNGRHEFRLTHVPGDQPDVETYTGQAVGDSISILLVRGADTAGRITTTAGTYNLRHTRYGLVSISPIDTSGALPELLLISNRVAPDDAAEYCPFASALAHDREDGC